MSPDTPAMRGLLAAINAKLTIPTAAHHADDDLELAAARAAMHDVQLILRALLDGPFDNCAVQSYGHVLGGQPVEVSYPAAERAA